MEYKEIKINLEQAKELLKTAPAFTDIIYENFPELKPKKRWFEEYEGGDYGVIQGSLSGIFMSNYDIKLSYENIHTFKTNEQAQQHAKKLNLYTEKQVFANFRNGDWVADWRDMTQGKYAILFHCGVLTIESNFAIRNFVFQIPVKSQEIAEEMLEEFGDRIKECFNLK